MGKHMKALKEKIARGEIVRTIVAYADENVDAGVERGRRKYYTRWRERTEEITGQPCPDMQSVKWDD